VSELFGCWDESALQIESTPTPETTPTALPGRRSELLALPPGPSTLVRQRSILLIAAAVVMVVGLSTVIAVTGGFKNSAAPVQQNVTQAEPFAAQPQALNHQAPIGALVKPNRSVSERREERRTRPQEKSVQSETAKAEEQSAQPIKVVMQIENGRVLKAAIANHKPGMDNYEALALRIARQRRYPTTTTGGETVTITVNR